MFAAKDFVVLPLIFRARIHFELLGYDIEVLLYVLLPWYHLLKTILYPLTLSWHFCHNHFALGISIDSGTLSFVLLLCVCLSTLAPRAAQWSAFKLGSVTPALLFLFFTVYRFFTYFILFAAI